MIDIENTPYSYENGSRQRFQELSDRVREMRSTGKLSPDVLYGIRKFFRIKSIYHSNAIEGNGLDVGETRLVVEQGLTISGKPLKDQAEAQNLSHALDFLEELAKASNRPISETDIRQIHALVLQGLNDGAGAYRTVPVQISGSAFPPPAPETVSAQMQEFSDWLGAVSVPNDEEFAGVDGFLAAATAHTWFVTIHPFIDGNGRVARLILNLLLMRFGFPIAIISKEDRSRYYDTLEESQGSDLTAFALLLEECVEESLDEWVHAAQEQREKLEWTQSLAQKLSEKERKRFRNEYEVWRNAMELLKSYFRQTVNSIDEATAYADLFLKDFGQLEFEKYESLRHGNSAKRTWFLRVDFRSSNISARYLFFFGFSSDALRSRCEVTLHVAREEPQGSYNYEKLDWLTVPNVPSLVEIGYDMSKERFVARPKSGPLKDGRIEEIGRRFFDDVVEKHFQA